MRRRESTAPDEVLSSGRCGEVSTGADGSMVLVGPGTQYQWAGCPLDDPSHRLAVHPDQGFQSCDNDRSPPSMTTSFVHRTWRLAVTIGPLVAIALTLAAGMKWR